MNEALPQTDKPVADLHPCVNLAMQTYDLNGTWELIERPLTDDADAIEAVRAAPAICAVEVPGDVNDALFRASRLPDPLVGTHARAYAAWVPERSWWYRRRIALPPEIEGTVAAELALDGLDVCADIWLNGRHLGRHDSAFLPFTADVTETLQRGVPNEVIVRLTTGRERVAGQADAPLCRCVPTEGPRGYPDRGFRPRIYLRKPAYTWGWDWSPHLPTVGITGTCSLRFFATTEVADVSLRPTLTGRRACVRARIELQHRTCTATAWGQVGLRLTDEDGRAAETVTRDVLIRSGVTLVDLTLDIQRPRLWWPNGSGSQHRYIVEAWVEAGGTRHACEPFRWGLRTVEMENKPGVFRFLINGQAVFIKGGNWIPCDHLYGRTTPERLERLVDEAADANFNCLRVWGGGRYERDAFFESCDRRGILLWHDFMSACAPLPYEEPAFAALFRAEAVYQVRRLRNRACLLLWCGNNEVGGCYEWFARDYALSRDPAWPLYFEDLPRIVDALAPHLPYWPTSPYGGATSVSDAVVGDDHHWVVMRPDPQYWSNPEYWDTPAIPIFNSEYGYGGPCCLESTRAYLGTDADPRDPSAHAHTNTFYDIPRVAFSITEQYGRDPAGLSTADYIRLGGLCQGLNLGYSLESLRANEQSWGGLFWMYDDAWGENGWTLVDYYLRRKIAYYNVARCLAPRRLLWRRGGQAFGGASGDVLLLALNDRERPWRVRGWAGYLAYDGAVRDRRPFTAVVPARSRMIVTRTPEPDAARLRRGTLAAVPSGADSQPATWRHGRYRDLDLPPARVHVVSRRVDGEDLLVRVASGTFAHAVSLDLSGDWRCDDLWFDLLPGERRTIRILGGAVLQGRRFTARCVNEASGGGQGNGH